MEEKALHVDEFLDDGDGVEQFDVFVLPLPVELDLRFGWSFERYYVREVLVLNRLVNGQSIVWVERDQFGEQVNGQRRHVGESLGPELVTS